MPTLLEEVAQMPDAAILFASGTGWADPPKEFNALRAKVETEHAAQIQELFAALDKRFSQVSGGTMNIFRGAAFMALMAQVGTDLQQVDRQRLRELWDTLLSR
jgi:hypothetical protein